MIYSSWDIECDRLKLVIMVHFLPFTSPSLKTQKIRILKKWKISSFYTSVPKTTIIWGTVPEIQSETDRFFCDFWPFYPPKNHENQNFKTMKKASWGVITLHMCINNHNYMMYASWDMEYNRHNSLSFWAIFCPFTQLLNKLEFGITWNNLE